MNYYIATRLENHAQHNALRDALPKDWTITYDWTHHGSVKDQGVERIQEVAKDEVKGVYDADVVIVLLPGGRGTHAELGIAIGSMCTNIAIVSPTPEVHFGATSETSAFYHAPGVWQFAFPYEGEEIDWQDLANQIVTEVQNNPNPTRAELFKS